MHTFKVSTVREVPAAMLAQIADLNSWIETPHKAVVRARWQESEMGDGWKFEIICLVTHLVLVRALDPAVAEGHTYSMFLQAMEEQHKRSFSEGLKAAAAKSYQMLCERLGINPEPIPYVKKGN